MLISAETTRISQEHENKTQGVCHQTGWRAITGGVSYVRVASTICNKQN